MKLFENLPHLWALTTLGNLSHNVQYGLTERATPDETGIFFLRITDIDDDGQLSNADPKYVPANTPNLSNYILEDGDVVIARSGSVGRAYIYQGSPEPWVFASYLIRFQLKKEIINPAFLGLYLRSSFYKHFIESRARGATVQNVNSKQLSRLPVPLPPLPEQAQIVSMLQEADGLRQLQQQAQQEAQTLIPALFHEMFGIEHKKEDKKKVYEIGDVTYGLTVNQTRRKSTAQKPYLRVANVYRDELDLSEVSTIGTLSGDLEKYSLQQGDILVVEGHANENELGRAAIWNNEVTHCLHQNHVLRIRPDTEQMIPEYLCGYINSVNGKRYMIRYGKTSSGLNTINSTVLSKMPIFVPPVEEQKIYQDLYKESKQYVLKHRETYLALDDLFDALLSQAFTGELTAVYRQQNQDLLQQSADARDRLLGGLTPKTAPIEEPVAPPNDLIWQGRDRVAESLSQTQQAILKTILADLEQEDERYFQPQTVIANHVGEFSPNSIRRTVALLEALGILTRVRLPIAPAGQTYYETFYRFTQPKEEA